MLSRPYFVAAILAIAACGDEQAKPADGHVPKCPRAGAMSCHIGGLGQAICRGEGAYWEYFRCEPDEVCVDNEGYNDECVKRECDIYGVRACSTETNSVIVCDGDLYEEQPLARCTPRRQNCVEATQGLGAECRGEYACGPEEFGLHRCIGPRSSVGVLQFCDGYQWVDDEICYETHMGCVEDQARCVPCFEAFTSCGTDNVVYGCDAELNWIRIECGDLTCVRTSETTAECN